MSGVIPGAVHQANSNGVSRTHPRLPQAPAACGLVSNGMLLLGVLLFLSAWSKSVAGQDSQLFSDSPVVQRYAQIVEGNPRYGTAFDRVLEYLASFRQTDQWLAVLETQTSHESALLGGMVHTRLGNYDEAQEAFELARQRNATNPLCAYYLAKTQILAGKPTLAVDSLQDAMDCSPSRQLLLEISMEQARLLRQLKRSAEALQVWSRLEKEFPGDEQVLQQIASKMLLQGDWESALERYEQLADEATDPLRRIEWRYRAAEIQLRLGRREVALSELEELAGRVNPGSWLHETIRNSLDGIFLQDRDYAGLIAYYRNWFEEHPQDIDAIVRCGNLLAIHGKAQEAIECFERATELAPSLPEPRLAWVEALALDGRYTEAAEQMQMVVQLEPGQPDYVVRWGELVYADLGRDQEERRAEAGRIWQTLLDGREDSPFEIVRVAEKLRSIGQQDQALELYRRAVELGGAEPQYREYLGEYLHALGRTEEALRVWAEIASGARATRDNYLRLSEVCGAYGFSKQALSAMEEACARNPDLRHRLRFAGLLREAGQPHRGIEQIHLALQQASDDTEFERLWDEEIACMQAAGTLVAEIDKARAGLEGESREDFRSWLRLAKMYQALPQLGSACEAVDCALELQPNNVALLGLAARLHEQFGNFGRTIESLRSLCRLDRGSRAAYIQQMAALEMRLGMVEKALETARELVRGDAATTDTYRYFADLCEQAGASDEAMQTLRMNVFANPHDPRALMLLADKLMQQFEHEEAQQVAWQAFDMSQASADQREVLELLTDLFLWTDQLDELVERLDLYGRERKMPRRAAVFKAIVFEEAGYYAQARELLQEQLLVRPDDLELLETAKRLCVADQDFAKASELQRRIIEQQPSEAAQKELAKLYEQAGITSPDELKQAPSKIEYKSLREYLTAIESNLYSPYTSGMSVLLGSAQEAYPDSWELSTYALILAFIDSQSRAEIPELADRLLAHELADDSVSARWGRSSSGFTRTDWLTRAEQNFSVVNTLARSRARSSANTLTASQLMAMTATSRRQQQLRIESYGDARAIAILVRAQVQPVEQELVVEQAVAAKDIEALWDCLLFRNPFPYDRQLLRLLQSQVGSRLSISVSGQIVLRRGEAQRDELALAILEELSKLKEHEATQLIISNLISKPQISSAIRSLRTRAGSRSSQVRVAPGTLEGLSSQEWRQLVTALQRCPDDQLEPLPVLVALNAGYTAKPESEPVRQQVGALQARIPLIQATPEQWLRAASGLVSGIQKELLAVCFDQAIQSAQGAGDSFERLGQSLPLALAEYLSRAQESRENDPTQLSNLLVRLLEWQANSVRKLRPSELSFATASGRATQLNLKTTIRTADGRDLKTISFTLPSPSRLLPENYLLTLRIVYESSQEAQELLESILSDAAEQQEDLHLRTLALASQACWLQWEKNNTGAADALRKAIDLKLGGDTLWAQLAQLHEQNRQYDRALEALLNVRPRNPQAAQDVELTKIKLATRAGNQTQAKLSAKRLFAMGLDSTQQVELARTMYGLDMREMADQIMNRLRRRRNTSPFTQLELLSHFIEAKNGTAALAIAKAILRKTQPAEVSLTTLAVSSRTARNRTSSPRAKALEYLKERGLLQELLVEAEEAYSQSPASQRKVNQVVELYQAAGLTAKAHAVILDTLQRLPISSSTVAVRNVQVLLGLNQPQLALDYALRAADQHPAVISQVGRLFSSSTYRKKIDWKKFAESYLDGQNQIDLRQSQFLAYMIPELLGDNEHELVYGLLRSQLKVSGFQALELLRYFPNGESNLSVEFLDAEHAPYAVDALIDFCEQDLALPRISRAPSFAQGRLRASNLLTSFDSMLREFPEEHARLLAWIADQDARVRGPNTNLLEAVMLWKSGQEDDAMHAAFEGVFSSRFSDSSVPALLEFCQLVLGNATTADLTHERCMKFVPILETAWERVRMSGQVNPNVFPLHLLVEIYVRLDRRADAIELLQDLAKGGVPTSARLPPGYEDYARTSRLFQIADIYLSIGEMGHALSVVGTAQALKSTADSNNQYQRAITQIVDSGAKTFFQKVDQSKLTQHLLKAVAQNKDQDDGVDYVTFSIRQYEKSRPKVDSSLSIYFESGSRTARSRQVQESQKGIADVLQRASEKQNAESLTQLHTDSLFILLYLAEQIGEQGEEKQVQLISELERRFRTGVTNQISEDDIRELQLGICYFAHRFARQETGYRAAARLLELLLDGPSGILSERSLLKEAELLVDLQESISDHDGQSRSIEWMLQRLPSDVYQRTELAWELIPADLQSVRPEVVQRLVRIAWENGPVVKTFQAPATRIATTTARRNAESPESVQVKSAEYNGSLRIANLSSRLADLDRDWRVNLYWETVFPAKRPSEIYLYSREGHGSTNRVLVDELAVDPLQKLRRFSAASELLKQASAAGRLQEVLDEARRRSAHGENEAGQDVRSSTDIKARALEIAALTMLDQDEEALSKLRTMVAEYSLESEELRHAIPLLFCNGSEELLTVFPFKTLQGLPIEILRREVAVQRLLSAHLHRAIGSGQTESVKVVVQFLEELYAYREISRKNRLRTIYIAVLKLAQEQKLPEIEDYYQQQLNAL